MNVYQLLKKDHEQVSQLFKKLLNTGENAAKTREKLFDEIKQELKVHTKLEEKLFYPALKEPEETHDLTLEAIEEHHVVDQLLNELDGMKKNSDQWIAKLTVLKENIEHHIEEEENDLFPKARQVLSNAQADEMGEQIAREKEKLLKSG